MISIKFVLCKAFNFINFHKLVFERMSSYYSLLLTKAINFTTQNVIKSFHIFSIYLTTDCLYRCLLLNKRSKRINS